MLKTLRPQHSSYLSRLKSPQNFSQSEESYMFVEYFAKVITSLRIPSVFSYRSFLLMMTSVLHQILRLWPIEVFFTGNCLEHSISNVLIKAVILRISWKLQRHKSQITLILKAAILITQSSVSHDDAKLTFLTKYPPKTNC